MHSGTEPGSGGDDRESVIQTSAHGASGPARGVAAGRCITIRLTPDEPGSSGPVQ